MSKILILANHYNTLRIFRRELIKELVKAGNTVLVSIPPADKENIKLLESYGCSVIITEMNRRGIDPFSDFLLLIRYLNLLRKANPDKVVTYTIKPNIYGSLACKIKKKDYFVNVTGLGSAFYLNSLLKKLVVFLYKISVDKAEKVFFENAGNRSLFTQTQIIPREKTIVMPGAGVNLCDFPFCEYPPDGVIRFLFIGRIMKEKGVDELFYAIKRLKPRYDAVEFGFIGWYEDNFKDIVADLENRSLIKYYGFQPDVKPYIKNAHCIILPSYHEGMSNTLLESAAMGRPLIASNIYGCKEAVIEGKSGLLANVKDNIDLYLKIKQFIELPYKVKVKMGQLARRHMETSFDKHKVVEKTLKELTM